LDPSTQLITVTICKMYKYVFIVAALCAFAADAALIKPSVSISSRRVNNPFGIVDGVEDCGSEGIVHEVRVTDCNRVPCDVMVGRTYQVEIDFTPVRSHPVIHLRVILGHDGSSHVVVDVPVPGSAVDAGTKYTFTYQMPVTNEFIGFSELWVGMLGTDEFLELCGIAGLNVYEG